VHLLRYHFLFQKIGNSFKSDISRHGSMIHKDSCAMATHEEKSLLGLDAGRSIPAIQSDRLGEHPE
jgi:hypothetical protein